MTSRRVLIVGAGGFLGSYIAKQFLRSGWEIAAVAPSGCTLPGGRVLSARLPHPDFKAFLSDFSPEFVVNAGGTASVQDSVDSPFQDFSKSVSLCAYLLDEVRQLPEKPKYIFLSSASVYGDPKSLPTSETAQLNPVSPYGVHKLMCERMIADYGRIFGISSLILRIFSAYGEGLRRQVVADICARFLDPTITTVKVLGTGKESRDFIHASDVATAIELLASKGTLGTLNLASGTETSIEALVSLIQRNSAPEKNVHYSGSTRRGDPLRWQADVSKLAREGFKVRRAMDEGISQFVQWMRSQSTSPQTSSPMVLMLSDQAEWFPLIQSSLRQLGCRTTHATSLDAAAFRLSREETNIVLVDANLPPETVRSWIQELRKTSPCHIPYLLVPQDSQTISTPSSLGCDAITPAISDRSQFLNRLQSVMSKR